MTGSRADAEARAEAAERARQLTLQANGLRAEGKWEEALSVCFEAYKADPNAPAAAYNLGVMLSKMGRLGEAEELIRHTLKLAPDAPMVTHSLAHIMLAQGRYREAWPLYEARVHMPELKTGFPTGFAFPRWRGESLAGKRLTVFPEQGLGDQIQLARFLPPLIEQAAAVTLLTLPPLERLFRHNFPGAEVIVATGEVEFADPDYWTTQFDILSAINLGLEDVPTAPYLQAPGPWPSLGEGFKIGLKAAGNPAYINDATRSLPPELADRLRAELPGRVISLEPEASGARDMADTAAIIDQLDMVVSVDTSVAHLAGAIGKRCLLLVSGFGADWRWLTDRVDSPWYPNHVVYRSTTDGEWGAAVDQLIADADPARARITYHSGRENAAAADAFLRRTFPKNTNPAMEPALRRHAAKKLMLEAQALRDAAQPLEALAKVEEAVAVDPDSVNATFMRGVFVTNLGRLQEGEAMLRQVIAAAPNLAKARDALSHNLLAQGRYREAWPFYEARYEGDEPKAGFPRALPFPRWQGEDLRGKRIAVFPEQGLGDQIQFARFLPRLTRMGAKVTLFAPLPLAELFRNSLTDVDVLIAEGSVDFLDPDYWAMLGDLPVRLDVQLDEVWEGPYLRPPHRADVANGGALRIGLKTQGNPDFGNDMYRSLPADLAEQLRMALPGEVIDLSPEHTGARDFNDTAALIDTLDFVVSVDTSVAHLAGAMGKPCLVLLSGFVPDWRWLTERSDSPWYPHHILYRRAVSGGWMPAIERLLGDIRAIAENSGKDANGAGVKRSDLSDERLATQIEALRLAGQPLEALALIERAVAANPASVTAAYSHGVLLTNFGRLIEGESVLRRVMGVAPHLADVRYALGANLLAQGRYHEGWPLYQARSERSGLNDGLPRDIPYPRWQGQNPRGKRIVIFPEQGFGDEIQFVRFLPRLIDAGAKVTLLVKPPLVELFRYNFPQVQIFAAEGAVDFPDPDYWVTLADLPLRFDVQPDQLGQEPYLRSLTIAPEGARDGFRVGLMTAGNPAFQNNHFRSLPDDLAARLAHELPGEVVDLRPEKTGARDFADTAAIIASLDLVVSVCTSVNHLAGAMGKTCLLMLPGFASDWRWMREREDSPWYPRHRLYRADVASGWKPVVDRVLRDAKRLSRSALRPMRRASVLRQFGRYEDAVRAGREALAIESNNVTVIHNLARLLGDLGRLKEAETLQRRALALSQGDVYRYALGYNLLSQGRYAEGWPLYESRARIPALRAGFPQAVKFPRWQGEDIANKRIAIFPEQGFGDQLQFARLLPRLRERCADVVLLAPPPLVRLFATAFSDVEVVAATGAASFRRCDVWTTFVELARLLDLRLEDIPDPHYLHLPSRPSPDGRLRIGFMGKGNPIYIHDAHRSLPREAAERLRAGLPGDVTDLDPAVSGAKDFLDTAYLMADLDLVVSVDTSVGHLAGVMGKPCYLLINGFATDWRWLRNRPESPWYPRHRLFRSDVDGNWDGAIADLLTQVDALAGQAAALPS